MSKAFRKQLATGLGTTQPLRVLRALRNDQYVLAGLKVYEREAKVAYRRCNMLDGLIEFAQQEKEDE